MKMIGCNNCLCNLEKCNAECCRLFVIKALPHTVYHKGQIIVLKCTDADMLYYYSVHNCKVTNNTVYIKLENFKIVGHKLFIYSDCQYLQNNKCIHHSDGLQPKICAYPNKDNQVGTDTVKIWVTPNCIYGGEIK